MTEPARRSRSVRERGGYLRRLEVLRRGAGGEPRHAEHPAGHHEPRRTERLGQDDADEPDDRAAVPRPRQHLHTRDLTAQSRSVDADHRLRHAVRHRAALGHRVHVHHHRAASFRIRPNGGGGKSVESARARQSHRSRDPQSRGVLQGHAAASATGTGHRSRSRCRCVGRAVERPRPAGSRGDDRPAPILGRASGSTSSSRATSSRRWT